MLSGKLIMPKVVRKLLGGRVGGGLIVIMVPPNRVGCAVRLGLSTAKLAGRKDRRKKKLGDPNETEPHSLLCLHFGQMRDKMGENYNQLISNYVLCKQCRNQNNSPPTIRNGDSPSR